MQQSPVFLTTPNVKTHLDSALFTGYRANGPRRPEPFGPKLALLEFRGACVINGSFYTKQREVEDLLGRFEDVESLLRVLGSSTGSFTLAILDTTTRDSYLLNDPLGGGFLFKYAHADVAAFSTDITSLRSVLDAEGLPVTRDAMFELSGFSTGTQHHASDTPFREISVLESGFGLRIRSEGSTEVVDYGINDVIYGDTPLDIQESINDGVSAIRNNVNAVLNYGSDLVISDITGGFDSRLVLAAISSLDACDAVVLRSLRRNAEWEFAENLAAAYGMELTDGRAFGEVWGIKQDLYEDSVAPARSSGGVIANDMGVNSVPIPLVKMQGGYGGAFRTFGSAVYSDKEKIAATSIAKDGWKWARLKRFSVGGEQLMSEAFEDELASRAVRTIEYGMSRGIKNSHIPSFWYGKGRLRYWFGQQSYHSSRNIGQFDPLYNAPLLAASYRLKYAHRKANLVGFEAMKKLDKRLIEYPFYNRGLPSELFLQNNPDIKMREFGRRDYRYRSLNIAPSLRLTVDLRRESVSAKDAETAHALGVKAEHVAGYRKWGPLAFDAVHSTPELRQMFNPRALQPFLHNALSDGSQARAAFAFLGALFRAGLLKPESQSRSDEFLFRG